MLNRQSFREFILHVCVNQPDEWWEREEKLRICLDNQQSLKLLTGWEKFPVQVIDRASKGRGWLGKRHGVGWARKTVMDSINEMASQDDLVISLDADTLAQDHYLQSIEQNFRSHPNALALSVPYYHRLTGDEETDRAILRYEIYMRNYAINLFRIQSPYSFTALGSAMAFPVRAYRKIGGMTPMMSGEDFYFLQKMVKAGQVLFWNREKVFPAARFSDRVYFGTGPAMEKGRRGDWESYPVYHHTLFNKIAGTYELFHDLYSKDVPTPVDHFLEDAFGHRDIWDTLRKNCKSQERFARACHTKIDGLRILQYLKLVQKLIPQTDEDCLVEFFRNFDPDFLNIDSDEWGKLNFSTSPIGFLGSIRDRLVEIEERMQIDYTDKFNLR